MDENTKNTRPAAKQYLWWAGFAFIVFIYLFGLTIPLLGPDEPRYAQVAREMFMRGDWVTPTIGGINWFEKPALLYWLQICAYSIFGISEFAARLGSALFGLGTIASLFVLGKAAVDERAPDLRRFPNYLALISASSLGLLVFSRGATFDIIVTFPITAALTCYFVYDRKKWGLSGNLPLVLFYFFIGLAVLAKGLIGILFPFSIVAFYHLISWRRPPAELLLSAIWGTAIAALIALTWYLPMYMRHGWEFVDQFIIQHHFQRFTSNKYQHPQPFIFFFWVLPLMTLPWLPFFLAAIGKQVYGFVRRSDQYNEFSPVLKYAAAWVIVPLLFFSFSGSKLPGYILPALPGALAITGVFVYGLVKRSAGWRMATVLIAGTMFVTVTIVLTLAVPRFAETDSVKSLVSAADEHGHSSDRLMMFYTLSHNAEFYAAGRLLRGVDGKQLNFYTVESMMPYLQAEPGQRALILAPLEHVAPLTGDSRLDTRVIADNTELAIVQVAVKPG